MTFCETIDYVIQRLTDAKAQYAARNRIERELDLYDIMCDLKTADEHIRDLIARIERLIEFGTETPVWREVSVDGPSPDVT